MYPLSVREGRSGCARRNVISDSGGTLTLLPRVSTCVLAPAAAPAPAPIAAPLPPPAIAPMIAPNNAPPPTYLPVLLLAPTPDFRSPDTTPSSVSTLYRRPLTTMASRSRTTSRPEVSLTIISTSEPRGIATFPRLPSTSSSTTPINTQTSLPYVVNYSVVTHGTIVTG